MDNRHGSNNQEQLFIANVNVVRELMRSLYLYGCFEKDDYYNGARMVDYHPGTKPHKSTMLKIDFKRFKHYLPDQCFDNNRIRFQRYEVHGRNDGSMIQLYLFSAYVHNAMIFYFAVLPFLHKQLGSVTLKQLKDCLPFGFDSKTVKKFLSSLEEEGFIICHRDRKTFTYALASDLLGCMNDLELAGLFRLLDFCSSATVCKTPFYLAARKIRLYLKSHARDLCLDNEMVYRQDYVFDVLDDEQMYQLLYALHEKQRIKITYLTQKRYDHSDPGHIQTKEVLPVKMITDDSTGRSSLLFVHSDTYDADIVRINRIYDVEMMGKVEAVDHEQAMKAASVYKDVWVASNDLSNEKDVQIRFVFDGEMGAEEENRLRFEKRNEEYKDGIVSMHVTDPHELVTWIRSYGDYAIPMTKELQDWIREDWEHVLERFNGKDIRIKDPVLRVIPRKALSNAREHKISLLRQYNNILFEALTLLSNRASHGQVTDISTILMELNGGKRETAEILANEEMPDIPCDKEVPVLLSTFEKEAIVNALHDPRARYFLGNKELQHLSQLFSDITPAWDFSQVEHKNKRKEEVENDSYAEIVSLIREAIQHHKAIRCDYQTRTTVQFHGQLLYPKFFEYTSNERLRVITWSPLVGCFIKNTVGRMSNVYIDENARKVDLDALWNEFILHHERTAVLELEPNEYALERMVRLFSCYDREMEYDNNRNMLRMTIRYLDTERLDIMRDILSCGDYISVKEPLDLVEGIHERVRKALELINKVTDHSYIHI